MKAQIVGINRKAVKETSRGSYDGVEVTYQPPPYKGQAKDPTTRFLFNNSDVVKTLAGIEVGDWVEIKFDDTKWKNPESFTKVSADAPAPGAPQQGGRSYSGGESDEKRKDIVRAVALKAGLELVAAQAAGGGYTAANLKKREFLAEEAVQSAARFESYLLGLDKVEGPDAVDNIPWEDQEQEGYDD